MQETARIYYIHTISALRLLHVQLVWRLDGELRNHARICTYTIIQCLFCDLLCIDLSFIKLKVAHKKKHTNIIVGFVYLINYCYCSIQKKKNAECNISYLKMFAFNFPFRRYIRYLFGIFTFFCGPHMREYSRVAAHQCAACLFKSVN